MKYNKGMPLYAVFPLLYREDVLSEAWKRVKANKGSSGVDGIEIEDIETMGIEKYLTEIKEDLMDGTLRPVAFTHLLHWMSLPKQWRLSALMRV